MNIAPHFLDRIRANSPPTADEFDLLETAIVTGWNIEHHPNGTHGTVTATGSVSERGRSVPMGETIQVPFNPDSFSGNNAMNWVVAPASVVTLCYALIGNRMILDLSIQGTTVSGVVDPALLMVLPGGFFAARQQVVPCRLIDNGVPVIGIFFTVKHSSLLWIARVDYPTTAFTASSGNTSVQGQLIIDVGTT